MDYKTRQQKAHNRKSFLDLPRYAQISLALDWLTEKPFDWLEKKAGKVFNNLALTVTFLGSVVSLIGEIDGLFTGSHLLMAVWAPGAFMALAIVYQLSIEGRLEKLFLREWTWKRLTFAQCHEQRIPVPDFAINTAIQVQEKLPGAKLYVDILASDDRMLGDPFLVLDSAGQEHYLEWWDESQFKLHVTD